MGYREGILGLTGYGMRRVKSGGFLGQQEGYT